MPSTAKVNKGLALYYHDCPEKRRQWDALLCAHGLPHVQAATEPKEVLGLAIAFAPEVLVLGGPSWTENLLNAAKPIGYFVPESRFILQLPACEEQINQLFALNAHGYLCAGATAEEMRRCLAAVQGGGTYCCGSHATTARMASHRLHALAGTPCALLSKREMTILKGMAQGLKNKMLADRFCISENTLKNHKSNIMRKLGFTHIGQLYGLVSEIGKADAD